MDSADPCMQFHACMHACTCVACVLSGREDTCRISTAVLRCRQAPVHLLRLRLLLPALLRLRGAALVVLLLQAPAAAHPELRRPVWRCKHPRHWDRSHHLVLPLHLPWWLHVLTVLAALCWDTGKPGGSLLCRLIQRSMLYLAVCDLPDWAVQTEGGGVSSALTEFWHAGVNSVQPCLSVQHDFARGKPAFERFILAGPVCKRECPANFQRQEELKGGHRMGA